MQLQYTDKNEIPEGQQEHFEEFKDGENTVYMHKDLAAAKREGFRLQGDLTKQGETLETIKGKLSKLETAESEAARLRAEKEEADKLKNGKHDEIIDDLRTRLDTQKSEYEGQLADLKGKAADKEKKAIVAGLAGLATKGNEDVLGRIVSGDIDVDIEGKVTIKGADGAATSQTLDEYKATLSEKYPTLVSAVQSKGGSGQGGDGGDANGKNSERVARLRAKVPALSKLPEK